MISLNSENQVVLELIKDSLFNNSSIYNSDVNWEKTLECAKKQCLVPLLASCVPIEQRGAWNIISQQNRAYFMRMIYEQNSLITLLNDNKIPFVILKGTAAAVYYNNPVLRVFGDIDFYISKNNLEETINLLKNKNFTFISNDDRQYVFNKNGISFELHTKFSCEHYKDIEHILVNGFNNAIEYKIGNNSFPGLPSYENGLVLLGHIMQHLKATGIGLRQVIDWMMYVYNELDDNSWDKHFKTFAIEAGLEKLAITVTYMCKKWLGLPKDITWCNDADENLAEQLLIRILDDGNLGHDRAPSESIKKHIKKEGVLKYLQRAGVENWPLAQKYKIFRPLACVFQLFRYIFKIIQGLFLGKKIFMKEKHYMSLEELLNRLE